MPVLFEFASYFFVSVVALAVDVALLLLLASYIHYIAAATLSFLAGALVHYALSVTVVFRRRRFAARRFVEVAVLVGVGVGALLVNLGVIAFCVEMLAWPLVYAKLVAAGASFVAGYAGRKLALF